MNLFRQIMRWPPLRAFLKDVSGSFAVIFALTLPVLLGGAALAIDYSNFQRSRVGVQAALDASALWYAQRVKNDEKGQENTQMLQDFFDLNLGTQTTVEYKNLESDWGSESLVVSVDVYSPSLFAMGTFSGTVETHVAWSGAPIEIALVIDTSGKLEFKGAQTTINDAIESFLDIYEGTGSKIGVVPFTDTINVGKNFSSAWLDVDNKTKYNGIYIDKPGGDGNLFTLFENLGADWAGCVEARPEPLDELDDPPSPINFDTYWVPYFQPANKLHPYLDVKDADNSSAFHPDDRLDQLVWDPALYTKARYTPTNAANPNVNCTPNTILDLTSNMTVVRNHINQLVYEGNSAINLGMVWGWRLLSPTPPFERGKAYTDPNVKKVILLITDGQNVISEINYTTYGYLFDERIKIIQSAGDVPHLSEKLLGICTSAKKAGIDIFTLGIAVDELTKIGNEQMTKLLDDCAGEQENSLAVSTPEELASSLTTVSNILSGLRIVR